MKKKLILLLSSMLVITISSVLITLLMNKEEVYKEEEYTIVTSFYPMYVLAKNIIGDTEGINLVNLTDYQSGCLHDYQLTTADMKRLEDADLFIMNGGGMENFMEDILALYPNLPVIDASKDIPMLASEHNHDHDHTDHDHAEDDHAEDDHAEDDHTDHDHTDHDHAEDANHTENKDADEHSEYNAHVWLNMDYHRVQIENVKNGLSQYKENLTDIFTNNAKAYDEKIVQLKSKYEATLGDISGNQVIIFHDAFDYLAEQLGLDVVYTIHMDNETSLSAGEIGLVVDEVNEHKIKVLFTEEQYSTSIPENIAGETDAKVYIIDSVVTGNFDEDGYIDAMNYNLEVLKEVYGK